MEFKKMKTSIQTSLQRLQNTFPKLQLSNSFLDKLFNLV